MSNMSNRFNKAPIVVSTFSKTFGGTGGSIVNPLAKGVEKLLGDVETPEALRVGVFRDQEALFVNEVVRRCRLDLVQLHGHEPRDYPSAIHVPVLRVLRVRALAVPGNAPAGLAAPLHLAPNVAGVLLDAVDAAGRSGGLGLAPDPAALDALRRSLPEEAKIFLSGGLTPENVAARARDVRPWAVDVSSGIESKPGVKDAKRMAAFVAALEESALMLAAMMLLACQGAIFSPSRLGRSTTSTASRSAPW